MINSYLELESLFLQEAALGSISAPPPWQTPTLGKDNTPTVVWTFREASTINHVVVDLLSIRSPHNRLHKISLSVLYHPRPLNTMADDASHCFYLSPHPFLALFC